MRWRMRLSAAIPAEALCTPRDLVNARNPPDPAVHPGRPERRVCAGLPPFTGPLSNRWSRPEADPRGRGAGGSPCPLRDLAVGSRVRPNRAISRHRARSFDYLVGAK
jgi:hypothetical protein